MSNFDINLDSNVGSSLQIKASGSIIQEAQNDLNLPEGESVENLLQNEKNIKK